MRRGTRPLPLSADRNRWCDVIVTTGYRSMQPRRATFTLRGVVFRDEAQALETRLRGLSSVERNDEVLDPGVDVLLDEWPKL